MDLLKNKIEDQRQDEPGNDVHEVVLLYCESGQSDGSRPDQEEEELPASFLENEKAGQIDRSDMKTWKAVCGTVDSP